MTIRDQLLVGFLVVLGIACLPIGLAIARTWNATLTAVALVGIIGALLIAASSVGSAAGTIRCSTSEQKRASPLPAGTGRFRVKPEPAPAPRSDAAPVPG